MRTLIHRWGLPALLALPTAAAWSASEQPASRASRPATTPAPATQTAAPAPAPAQPSSPVGRQLVQLTHERLAAAPSPAATATAAAAAATIAEPAAPAGTPEERIKALEEKVRQLMERIDQLEKKQAPAAPPVEAPPPAAPPVEAPFPETGPPPAPPTPTATLLPNISGLGNFKFVGSDSKGTENRGKVFTDEFEIGLQDRVAPDLRLDAFLTSGTPDFTTSVEEAYATWSNPLGINSLSARIGKQRTPFGKLNPQHPHTWMYITQPSAITALLGADGLNADGIVGQYLVPIGGTFLNLELGRWITKSAAENGLGFAGGQNGAYSGRLWFGKEVGRDRELELGLSTYLGRGDVEGDGRRQLAVTGLDFTYRNFPGAYQRLMLQGELIRHTTGGYGGHPRLGGYLTLAKRFSQYYEAGLRGDYTRFPYPTPGHESAASLFLTRFITEQTALRMELRHGARPVDGGFNEIWFQLLTGFGPHSHNLQ